MSDFTLLCAEREACIRMPSESPELLQARVGKVSHFGDPLDVNLHIGDGC